VAAYFDLNDEFKTMIEKSMTKLIPLVAVSVDLGRRGRESVHNLLKMKPK
jgi:hypothetical protein